MGVLQLESACRTNKDIASNARSENLSGEDISA